MLHSIRTLWLSVLGAMLLVSATGVISWLLERQDVSSQMLSSVPPGDASQLYLLLAGLTIAGGALGAIAARAPRSLATVAMVLLAGTAYAAFLCGQWSMSVGSQGLLWDELLTPTGSKDITAQVSSLVVERLGDRCAPDLVRLTLESGAGLMLDDALSPGAVALIDDLLAKRGVRPTLSLRPNSAATDSLEALLVATRERFDEAAPYLDLFRAGKACATRVSEAATTTSQQYRREDSLRGPLLALVSAAMFKSKSLTPSADEEAALLEQLEERLDKERTLIEAAVQASRDGLIGGIDTLVGLLDDPSYRLRHLAAQNLLVMIPVSDYPPGTSTLIPERDEFGAWTRFRAAWRGWLAANRDKLISRDKTWSIAQAGPDLAALTRCANQSLECLGQVVDALLADAPEARRGARSLLEAVVCPTELPELTPPYELDEAWPEYAAAWRKWFDENRLSLQLKQCDPESAYPRWMVER